MEDLVTANMAMRGMLSFKTGVAALEASGGKEEGGMGAGGRRMPMSN